MGADQPQFFYQVLQCGVGGPAICERYDNFGQRLSAKNECFETGSGSGLN